MLQVDTDQVWRALSTDLRRYVARRAGNTADVDDLVQDVFERVYAARDSLRDDLPLQPWVFTVAHNVVIDHLRRKRPPQAGSDPDERADPLDLERRHVDAELASFRKAMGTWLADAIRGLPEPYREAVARVDVEGESQRDVATALGLSYSGLKSRVQRGRAKLRAQFLECCHVELDRRGAVTAIRRRSGGGGSCCD